MALVRSGLWWVGLCCGERIHSGMVCGWLVVFGLSFWRPSSSGWRICGSCDALSSLVSGLSVVKSLIGVLSRSTRRSSATFHRLCYVGVYGGVGRCCCVVWS